MGGGRGGGTVMLQRELQCVSFFSCDKKQVCGPFSFFFVHFDKVHAMFGEWLNKWAIICCSQFRGSRTGWGSNGIPMYILCRL